MWIRWYVPVVVLAMHPVLVVVGANLATVPLREWVVTRALLVADGAAALILIALRVPQRDLPARAAWLSWFLIFFNLYGASARGLRWFNLQIHAPDPLFAVPYVLASGVIAAIAVRPWEVRPRDPVPMTIAAALFALVGFVPAGADQRRFAGEWTASANALMESTLSKQSAPAAPPNRDIYYVVLDSLGSPEALRRSHNVDLAPFVDALRARGFYVVEGARSNYAQTYLSLASTLNMAYLDDIARRMGPDAANRAPLAYLIAENALMQMASRAGYRVVGIGSDYPATQRLPRADVCVCSLTGLDEVEIAAMGLTPLAALSLDLSPEVDPYAVHRRKVLAAFEAISAHGGGGQPTVVFGHILLPHGPFVFDRDGAPVRPPPRQRFSLAESDAFVGSPSADAYGQQAQFALTRMIAAIDTLLKRPGPSPAIVVHGDHGPGRGSLNAKNRIGVQERMEIFAAFSFPEGADDLYPAMTPLNGARLLARRYFGAELPLLPDRSMFSPLEAPYDLVPVP